MSKIFVDMIALERHKDTLTNEYHITERLVEHLRSARRYDDYEKHRMYDSMIRQCDEIITCIKGMINAIETFQEDYRRYDQYANETFSYERHKAQHLFD